MADARRRIREKLKAARHPDESGRDYLARQLAVYLEGAGLTKADLAARAGAHPSDVSKLLAGERRPAGLIGLLSRVGVQVPEEAP